MNLIIYQRCKSPMSISDVTYYYRDNNKGICAQAVGNPKIIDTFYITQQLLADAKELNIHFNDYIYDTFLNQVKVNAYRIFTLNNREINKAIFVETLKLKDKYFKNMKTKKEYNKLLEFSLEEQNFYIYLLYFNKL